MSWKTKERNIRIRKVSSGSSGSSPNENQARIFEHEKANGDDGDDTFQNYKEKENESEDETVFESDEDPSNYDDDEEPDTQ